MAMTKEMWDSLRSSMGQSPEQDASIRESVRQAVVNGATVPPGSQTLLPSAASWMPGQEQYPMFTGEADAFGYGAIDEAATDVLSQFAPSIADPSNKMTETKVTTKDADGNETTIIKKGKFDESKVEARNHAAGLELPRMIDGSNNLLFPQSMVATAREGNPQEIADRNYAEWEAKMKSQGQVMGSQGSYQPMTTDDTYFGIPGERSDPMALDTRSLGTSYSGAAMQDPSIFDPLGTSYSGSPTQANYDSLMESRAYAAGLELPHMIDGSNSLIRPATLGPREETPQETKDREYAAWEAKMRSQGQVLDSQGSYQPMTTDDTYFGIPGERSSPFEGIGGPSVAAPSDNNEFDTGTAPSVKAPNSVPGFSKADADEIKSNPSATAAVTELKERIDANPETKQEEYISFLKEIGHLEEWRPQLFKALTSAAVALVTGGDAYQTITDSLGYQGEEKEKLRLEDREDDKDMLKLLMDNSEFMDRDSFLSSLASIKGISAKKKKIIEAAYTSGQRGKILEAATKVAEDNLKSRNDWYVKDMKFIKDHIKDEDAGSRIASQLNPMYNYLGDRLKVNWADFGVHGAITKGMMDAEKEFMILEDKSNDWFDNDQTVKVNLLGHVLNNFVLHNSQGAISKESNALKHATHEQYAYVIDWMFKQPTGSRKAKVEAKIQEWEGAKEGRTDDWKMMFNFALWLEKNQNSLGMVGKE